MPDALRVAIDPYLLCLPNPCYSLEQIERFVNSLLGWNGILRRPEANVLVADTARMALLDDGEYPYPHKLRGLLQRHNCDFADHETICRLSQNLLDRTPSLEEFYGVNAILVDETKTQVTPCAIVDRLKSKTRSAFIEMLVIVLVEKHATVSSPRGSTTIASTMEGLAGDADLSEIQFDSELYDWSWSIQDRYAIPPFPAAVSGLIPLATSHNAFLRQLGVWELWKNATDAASAVDAIELCIDELVASGSNDEHRTRFQLGPGFLESARTWGFGNRSDYARLLVESCARIVLNIPKHLLGVFHEHGDSTRQRRRGDGALAFRTHLTKKSAGFRLMLWKLPDGTIEFANVGDKDELSIL
ncbi:MAG TPA: hypothetical protein DD706_24505 [Nitrospiraceae bacterium]|nr:hypothetical protein [Nitrospiraceae bacterium]